MLLKNAGLCRIALLLVVVANSWGCSSIRIESVAAYEARTEALELMSNVSPAAGYANVAQNTNVEKNNQ